MTEKQETPRASSSADVDRWKRDLITAGWIAESATAWRAPDSSLWRGPFGAWKELQRRAKANGTDTNWPLCDVLTQLVEWAKHLHDDHDCDCHGWEARSFLIEAAQRYQAEIAQVSSCPASTAPVVEIAHVCTNGVYRPYPAVLCSSCKYVTHGLSVKELCERLNAAATAAPVEQSAIDLDPLEFWCDLVEVLGHPRPVKVNPVSVIAEVEERLRQIPPTKGHADVTDDEGDNNDDR